MADYYYGINKGLNEYTATVGTSTQSTTIEVRVNDTVTTRQEVINALRSLENFLTRQNYPPA